MSADRLNFLQLPREVLSNVLAHLPIGDVARALRTCGSLALLAEHTTLWADVLARYCGLELADPSTAAAALKLIWASPPLRLKFVGTLTDGGIDDASYEFADDDEAHDRDLQYWAGSLFDNAPWLIYCSASGRADITCVAVLDGLHDWLAEDREQARRAFMLDRLALIVSDWWPVDGFGGLANASSQVLDEAFLAAIQVNMPMLLHGLTNPEERAWHLAQIQRIGAQIAERTAATQRYGRPPRLQTVQVGDTCFTVDSELPVVARPHELAVACRLIMRRSLSCSCPVSHGVIFGSRERLEAEAFFDGPQALGGATAALLIDDDGGWVGDDGAARIDGLGAIVARTRSADGEVIELAPAPPAAGSRGLCPIALFSFTPLPPGKLGVGQSDVHQLAHTLAHARCLRTLVVKLLRAEDRMEACEDDHDTPNLDMEYVGIDGHTFSADLLKSEPVVGSPLPR